MIKSFRLENFRSYRELELTGLPIVNVLVGKSAAGKTSLLEALRLGLAGTPTVAWALNAGRGLAIGIPFNPARELFESAWSAYFPDFDVTKTISFKLQDSEDRIATLDMFFDKERPVTPIPNTVPGMPAQLSTIIPLAFRRTNFSGEQSMLDATIHQQQHGQLHLQQGPELGTANEFFPSTWQSNLQQAATWFSNLRISNRSDDIIAIVHKQFPEVTSISSEAPQGFGQLYATVKHHSKMMPISLLSSGISKFISLLIAIRTYRNGVVLIDEVENGIYYGMFPAFWEALHRFAVENNTQLFLSSHSWECLKAASTVIAKHPKDFSLIQVTQDKGFSTAVVIPGSNATAAIDADIEVRR